MTVLPPDRLHAWKARLQSNSQFVAAPSAQQPLHVVYGGAHRFGPNVSRKLGELAAQSLATYAPDAETFGHALGLSPSAPWAVIYARVRRRLAERPVEDFRIDFEDGYGARPDDEEDRDATEAGRALTLGLREGTLPPNIGIRIKGLNAETGPRALRTLALVFDALDADRPPEPFCVTLPKVAGRIEVEVAAEALDAVEQKKGWPSGCLRLEVMVEHPAIWFDADGRFALPTIQTAAQGRLSAVHLGPYDYTASLGIAGSDQALFHPALDVARHWMQVAFAGSSVRLGDGPTNLMPIPPHRGTGTALSDVQMQANRDAVHRAWRHHAQAVQESMRRGFDLGWDLHPAQIPARLGAVYAGYLAQFPMVAARLRNFVAAAGQATRVGAVFDDAATGQGLVNFCLRALGSGAVTEKEVTATTGLDLAALATRSFATIVARATIPGHDTPPGASTASQ